MELYEANRILRSVKSAIFADGYKLPPAAETDGLMMLLGKLDCEKFLTPKIKRARSYAEGTPNYVRSYAYLAFFRGLMAMKSGIQDPVTSVSVMFLHKTLCGDLDPEAGKPRGSEATTEGSAHTDPKYIYGSLKSVITKMNDIAKAPAMSKEDFAGYLTHYMRELLIMHPFEHGSEYTVRLFLMLFSKLKGFSLGLYRIPSYSLKEAEKAAFLADDISPLYKVFLECLTYEHTSSSQPQKQAPQTRREITFRPRREPVRPEQRDEIASVRLKATEKPANDNKPTDGGTDRPKQDKPKSASAHTDDVLKRAIKLQQKITKLNEQLTDLISQTKQDEE